MSSVDATKKLFLETAEKYVGVEEETPQHLALLAIYNSYKDPGEYSMQIKDPWCAAFVGAISAIAGTMKIIPLSAACSRLQSGILAAGGKVVSDPEPCDIFFRGEAHTGIVASVHGSHFTSIEGNYADKVSKVYHDFSGLTFVRPNWGEETSKSEIKWTRYRDFYQELSPSQQEEVRKFPLLYGGCGGIFVKIAQKYLEITEDGHFGTNTETAVKLYQKKRQLEVDGQIGKQTWSSFFV